MSEQNVLMALKNAWTGAVNAADRLRELAPAVAGLPPDATLTAADLEIYHNVVLADANAVMALRGLVEQLRSKAEPAAGA
jgi:hypothetical protein